MGENVSTVQTDDACFVCGRENSHGLNITFSTDAKKQTAEAETFIKDRFQGWQGIVHGGIIAALLDEAAIYACRALSLEAVTAELTIRYRKPVPTGQQLRVCAEVIDCRRRVVRTLSRLTIAGEVYAEAEGKIILLNSPKIS